MSNVKTNKQHLRHLIIKRKKSSNSSRVTAILRQIAISMTKERENHPNMLKELQGLLDEDNTQTQQMMKLNFTR